MAREKGKKYIVGLSWRSLISDRKRDMIRLPDWLLEGLLNMEEILFVNCQYTPLSPGEIQKISNHDNMIIFEEVDQLDDIETTASLYSALDLMITASTFSGDLSGAIGVHTLIPVRSRVSLAFCAGNEPWHLQSEYMEFFPYSDERDMESLKRKVRESLGLGRNPL